MVPYDADALEREHEGKRSSGGLLCDAMGLGKTLQLCALVALHQSPLARLEDESVLCDRLEAEHRAAFIKHEPMAGETADLITLFTASQHVH